MSFKDFDMERWQSLGREFSQAHKDFKKLAHLGNANAKKQAAISFFFWLQDHKDASLQQKLERAIELLGEAEFLTLAKAWERMTLSLGDTAPKEKYRKAKVE